MTVFTTSPPRYTFIAGIDGIWYLAAVCGLSSTLSLTTLILSECSDAIWSRIGETARHGPHHSAQKSTRMVSSDFRTSSSKVASVTSRAVDIMLFLFSQLVRLGRNGHDGLGDFREEVFGIEGGDSSRTGRGHRLPVGGVDNVARG